MKQDIFGIPSHPLDETPPNPPIIGEQVIHPSSSDAASPAKRVLIAEDDEGIRQLVAIALRDGGFDVTAVADGAKAWRELGCQHYDLLITDHNMPELTGGDLIGKIRAAGLSLPIILASGSFTLETLEAPIRQRISAFLPKPYGLVELIEATRRILTNNFPHHAESNLPPSPRPQTAIHPEDGREQDAVNNPPDPSTSTLGNRSCTTPTPGWVKFTRWCGLPSVDASGLSSSLPDLDHF